ncbi:hypothetical protein [Acidithiobacillus sp.]
MMDLLNGWTRVHVHKKWQHQMAVAGSDAEGLLSTIDDPNG